MNYKEVSYLLCKVATSYGCNTSFEGDVYGLDSMPGVEYAAFCVTPISHTIDINTVKYSVNLFYIDRLTHSMDNVIDVQSAGIQVLNQIINKFSILTNYLNNDIYFDYPLQVTPFRQKFSDECAGVYVKLDVHVRSDLGECPN